MKFGSFFHLRTVSPLFINFVYIYIYNRDEFFFAFGFTMKLSTGANAQGGFVHNMIKSLFNPAKGKMRVAGIASGSGNTLWAAYDLQKEMENTFEGCPFEIVGIFADSANAKCLQTAAQLGISSAYVDIKKFYDDKGAPLKDRTVRAAYDREMVKAIAAWKPDFVMLAGYVWAVTDVVMDSFNVYGVHPGDLTYQDENGKRLLAGSNGVKSAFAEKRPEVRASSYLATNQMDGGPILITSPATPVDYALHDNEEDRFRYYLKKVNEQSRLVGARTTLEIANGNFQIGDDGYYYKNEKIPLGIKFESWEEDQPRFRLHTDKITNPRSIAVLGASNKKTIGNAALRNLVEAGFTGELYAVNMRGEDVLGAKGYSSILDIPGPVDMAMICVPSRAVLSVVDECGRKGVKALVCITAGFREVGGEGAENEKKLLALLHKYGMVMTGPNCMGVINTGNNMNATMLSDAPAHGNLAMLTQSGALGAAMEDFTRLYGIGFSLVVSLGNQADLNMCDFLPIAEADPGTKVVLMYIEGITEPQRFRCIVSKMTKPVIVFKAGKTAAGAEAASSHTGSLAGSHAIAAALIEQSGAIECSSLEDAFRLAATLSKIDRIGGKRVGIVSNTGGIDIIMADALTKKGFELPALPQECVDFLRPHLLPEAAVRNPIDIVAPATPEQYALVADVMTKCGCYDAVLFCVVPAATVESDDIARALVAPAKASNVPILSCFYGPYIAGKGAVVMKENGIPTYEYPEKMADMLEYLVKKPAVRYEGKLPSFNEAARKAAIACAVRAESGKYLSVQDCETIMNGYGIPITRSGYMKCEGCAKKLELTFPVVAKIDHPDIIHKADVGGVVLGIDSKKELVALYQTWQSKFPGMRGIFVQEQVSGKIELIIGASHDTSMGHGILAGMGGTLVELMHDTQLAHVPVAPETAAAMLERLQYYPVLQGYRGAAGVNVPRFEELILRVNQMLLDIPEIGELDINPLLYDLSRGDFVAVDFRIKMR